jgi:hypothetical protein
VVISINKAAIDKYIRMMWYKLTLPLPAHGTLGILLPLRRNRRRSMSLTTLLFAALFFTVVLRLKLL